VGGIAAVEYERGLTDAFWLRLSGGGGLFSADGLAWGAFGVAGVMYRVDVLRYVPWVSLGVGVIGVGGGSFATQAKALVEVGVGLDILQSTTLSYGVEIRVDSFASQVVWFTVGPRISWRWGYF
jgi:hypothetical protein